MKRSLSSSTLAQAERALALPPSSSAADLDGVFRRLVEHHPRDLSISPLERTRVFLARVRGVRDALEWLESRVAASSAAAVRAKYRRLYEEAGVNREREDEMRDWKRIELMLLIVVQLEVLAERQLDVALESEMEQLVALFEAVSVLLVNPSVDPWLDLIDFCAATYQTVLSDVLHQLFEELEVEPNAREKNKRDASSEADDSRGEHEVKTDLKRLKTELQTQASATAARAPARTASTKSLGSLRKKDRQQKSARVKASSAAPQLIERKVSRHLMGNTAKKQD